MSRDLFAEASHLRHAPRRSGWTIVGSALVHAVVLAFLLVIPILSALDDFVLRADDSMTFVMPSATLPPSPPPPRAETTPALNVSSDVAPVVAPDRITTPPASSGSGPGVSDGVPGISWAIGTGLPSLNSATVTLAPPPPVPVIPVRPGGDLKFPARTAYVAPIYPPLAKTIKQEGAVILEATIDEAGLVRDIRVLRSQSLFDQAAIDAVRQWRYAPTRLNGVAVPVLLTVTVLFTLK